MLRWLKYFKHKISNTTPDKLITKIDILLVSKPIIYRKNFYINSITIDIANAVKLYKDILDKDYYNNYIFDINYKRPSYVELHISKWYSVDNNIIKGYDVFIEWLTLLRKLYIIYSLGMKRETSSKAYKNSVKLHPYIEEAKYIIDNLLN